MRRVWQPDERQGYFCSQDYGLRRLWKDQSRKTRNDCCSPTCVALCRRKNLVSSVLRCLVTLYGTSITAGWGVSPGNKKWPLLVLYPDGSGSLQADGYGELDAAESTLAHSVLGDLGASVVWLLSTRFLISARIQANLWWIKAWNYQDLGK